MQAVFLVKL